MKLRGRFGRVLLGLVVRAFPAPVADWEYADPHETSGLRRYFGAERLGQMRGKRVLDFGCGRGADAVAVALAGASEVVGVDVQAHLVDSAKALAEKFDVTDVCRFIDARTDPAGYAALDGGFDVVYTIDAFEHFSETTFILGEMDRLLAPGGKLLISFGPPWKHPYGAHLMDWTKAPWMHFFFDEETVLAVRARFLADGAQRYAEVPGGLNGMAIARFREIVEASRFRFIVLEPVPIRPLRAFARFSKLREYVTSVVHAECVRASG
jgi:2-polyprenyl-3-methyl-5-hydroxy-6-metoxy-1,4-benzoquinol methylase